MNTKKPTSDSPTSKLIWINISNFESICFNLARESMTFDQPFPAFYARSAGILESCLETPVQQFKGKGFRKKGRGSRRGSFQI